MVRILSFALPLLALASQSLASYYGAELIGRDVDLAVRHDVYPRTSVEAALHIDVELDAVLGVIVGLGDIDLGVDLDLELGKGGLHLGVGVGLHAGLSLDVCLRALLAKVMLTLDGTKTCSGPSKEVLKQPLSGRKSIPCQCTDPNVKLELVVPEISLDVIAKAILLAQIDLLFSLTRNTKTYDIVASKSKVQYPGPKKCKLGYEKTIQF